MAAIFSVDVGYGMRKFIVISTQGKVKSKYLNRQDEATAAPRYKSASFVQMRYQFNII